MNLEWIAEDDTNTIGHVSKMNLDGFSITSPMHVITSRDLEIANRVRVSEELKNTKMFLAGECLSYQAFNGVGINSDITEAIFQRIKAKIVKGKANLVQLRVPEHYEMSKSDIRRVTKLSPLQTSGIVGIQLEVGASAITPPLHQGISSSEVFNSIYETTKTEIQTYNREREIIGYIPTTKELRLVSDMVKTYVKDGIRFFAVDFSSSPLNRWLLRTVVTALRVNLKIKGTVKEKTDKQYYLHVFNIASSKKSINPITPITDVLTHSYGVDSTSGVIWGGGQLVKNKLRYFNMQDYGAYQINSLDANNIHYNKLLTEGSVFEVYDKLRTDKNTKQAEECEKIREVISGNDGVDRYAPYLTSKTRAIKEVNNALIDIKEIKANSSQ